MTTPEIKVDVEETLRASRGRGRRKIVVAFLVAFSLFLGFLILRETKVSQKIPLDVTFVGFTNTTPEVKSAMLSIHNPNEWEVEYYFTREYLVSADGEWLPWVSKYPPVFSSEFIIQGGNFLNANTTTNFVIPIYGDEILTDDRAWKMPIYWRFAPGSLDRLKRDYHHLLWKLRNVRRRNFGTGWKASRADSFTRPRSRTASGNDD